MEQIRHPHAIENLDSSDEKESKQKYRARGVKTEKDISKLTQAEKDELLYKVARKLNFL